MVQAEDCGGAWTSSVTDMSQDPLSATGAVPANSWSCFHKIGPGSLSTSSWGQKRLSFLSRLEEAFELLCLTFHRWFGPLLCSSSHFHSAPGWLRGVRCSCSDFEVSWSHCHSALCVRGAGLSWEASQGSLRTYPQ